MMQTISQYRGGVAHSEPAAPWVIRCPEGVIAGCEITKDVRMEMFGSVNGGAGSSKPENWQRQMIERGTGIPCPKTNMRINLRTNVLEDIAHPNRYENGFDYSEDFDGVQQFGEKKVFIDLKCISDKGGSQTRSLREVYRFVEGQLNVLKKKKVYFANILDGDACSAVSDKFAYLLGLPEYVDVKDYVYVGDLKNYFAWVEAMM